MSMQSNNPVQPNTTTYGGSPAQTSASGVNRSSDGESASSLKRERTLSLIAGGLGILMFVWGFLRWLNVGDGDNEHRFSGYAFSMPTTAVIGLSLAAGLIAALGATERRAGRGVPSAIPTGLAATSLLLAIAIFLGKGEISPNVGSQVGVEIGLILALITAAIQTAVLAMCLASRHDDDRADTRQDTVSNQNVTTVR